MLRFAGHAAMDGSPESRRALLAVLILGGVAGGVLGARYVKSLSGAAGEAKEVPLTRQQPSPSQPTITSTPGAVR